MIQFVLLRAQIWKWSIGYRNLASHSCRNGESETGVDQPDQQQLFLII